MFRMIKKIIIGLIVIPLVSALIFLFGLIIKPDLLMYSPVEQFGLLERPEPTVKEKTNRYIGHYIYDEKNEYVIIYIDCNSDDRFKKRTEFIINFRDVNDEYVIPAITINGHMKYPTKLEIPLSKEEFVKTEKILITSSTITYYFYETKL